MSSSSKLVLDAQERAYTKELEAQRLLDKLRRKDLDQEEQKKREQVDGFGVEWLGPRCDSVTKLVCFDLFSLL